MLRNYGILLPPDLEWQIGKTAASIKFVNDALEYIANCSNNDEIERLKNAMQAVKDGVKELAHWLSIEEFLKRDGGAL